ncbi:MAG: ATP-binding protein [Oscillospiraceae bacterium]|nr:ATP-binding protein [Oscillospiraceae bacterium]
MLYNLEAVKANIRNRDGKRVFFLGKGDQLTTEARDHLNRERIEIRPGEQARITQYRLLGGGLLTEKPEDMTHLYGDVLVFKTHPRIGFRGAMDSLEAALLFCGDSVGEILELARRLIRCEVMDEPVGDFTLYGLTEAEQRKRSHFPQDYYGQPHFMPNFSDGEKLLRLNQARCAARAAELAAAQAFSDGQRPDIQKALNRMSSMLYILMIQEKAK